MYGMERTNDSPPSSASEEGIKADPQVSDGRSAFLVHSQGSSSQQKGPDVDYRRLARQKRRRTSPEDQAILEAEYERNCKPDKPARMEVVKRVALGEKEVQIWFQNRRQMTRRKSRPLLPHEIFSFQSSQEQSDSATATSSSISASSQQQQISSQSSISNGQQRSADLDAISDLVASTDAKQESHAFSTAPLISNRERIRGGNSDTEDRTSRAERAVHGREHSQARVTDLVRSLSQRTPVRRRPSYLTNRCSASFIIHDEHRNDDTLFQALEVIEDAREIKQHSASKPLKRTSSLVRLSLSLDGKAVITPGTGSTPSPPRSMQAPPVMSAPRSNDGLRRSFSAVDATGMSRQGDPPISFPRRPMSGRSRDARTWEFYCDSDARNALTEQAELEESGSATAAIGLIRSHSNKSKTITPNLNKRIAQTQKSDSAKRVKADGQKTGKPKLGRATSSIGRMQTTSSNSQFPKPAVKHTKSNSQTFIWQEQDGDSDKENWEPGTQTRNPPRPRPGRSRTTMILEESLRIPSQSSSLDALMSRESNTSRRRSEKGSNFEGKENAGGVVDDEVAAFMGDSGPREVEELDCVQNLLSLSQAAWQ